MANRITVNKKLVFMNQSSTSRSPKRKRESPLDTQQLIASNGPSRSRFGL
jgi:hypothetical protein